MRCPACEPDYCACADFYGGRLKYWKGEMMTDKPTSPDLAALSAAATQGGWSSDRDLPHNRMPRVHGGDHSLIAECGNMGTTQDQWEANAALITTLVNEYRAGRLVHIDEGMREATARTEAAEARNKVLEEALDSVMVGGNHLALLIGVNHPAYGTDHYAALQHYGAGDQYEVWCAWNAIMLARKALGGEHE